jgi:PKD repeat protein
LNAEGSFELCAETGLVKLLGFPAASTGKAPETQFVSVPYTDPVTGRVGPLATIVKNGDDYFIQTNGLASDMYRVEYTYRNEVDAITTAVKTFRLFAAPIADFTSSNNCIAADIEFFDASTIRPTPFPTVINSWRWDFDDAGELNSNQNPSKRYEDAGEYDVILRVQTAQGCAASTASTDHIIRVGDIPVPNFAWSAICNNDVTKFEDLSTVTVSNISNYEWDFGDGNTLDGAPGSVPGGTNGGSTSGTFANPNHEYAFGSTGEKTVTLIVSTDDGCVNQISKKIFILPYETLTPSPTDAYFQNFNDGPGGWIAEAFENRTGTDESDTSWVWGIPNGDHIINAGNPAWWTGNYESYKNNEHSFVNGPCFNLSDLKRPMISLDYVSDTESADGTVLQYSVDGGLNWHIVGSADAGATEGAEGINWYNASSIFSNPGKQQLGQLGWNGPAKLENGKAVWRNGRFNLDMIPKDERDQVRLRFAFASNDGNATKDSLDGFAFDNVFVGDKKRTVIVEHFTNEGSPIAKAASIELDTLYREQLKGPQRKDESDFFKIQYHVAVPSEDPINQQNEADPAARRFFYNIGQPPATIMDGITGPYAVGDGRYTINLSGNFSQVKDKLIDQRALEDPLFQIRVTPLASDPDVIKATLEFEYIDSLKTLGNPLIFHAALIEGDVNGNWNVVRKLMLNGDGRTENRTWKDGDIYTIDLDYEIDVPITDPSNVYVVAFVQDKTTTRIHQSTIVKLLEDKIGVTPVGVVDDPITAEVRAIHLYPNPASKEFNLSLDNVLTRDYRWELIDQRGVAVSSGDLNHDLRTPQQISVRDLANGVYFLKIASGEKALVYRKVVVLNSH